MQQASVCNMAKTSARCLPEGDPQVRYKADHCLLQGCALQKACNTCEVLKLDPKDVSAAVCIGRVVSKKGISHAPPQQHVPR